MEELPLGLLRGLDVGKLVLNTERHLSQARHPAHLLGCRLLAIGDLQPFRNIIKPILSSLFLRLVVLPPLKEALVDVGLHVRVWALVAAGAGKGRVQEAPLVLIFLRLITLLGLHVGHGKHAARLVPVLPLDLAYLRQLLLCLLRGLFLVFSVLVLLRGAAPAPSSSWWCPGLKHALKREQAQVRDIRHARCCYHDRAKTA
mmetsp:Transcript_27200/g.61714  ORF Transcript_27200/g.61714 Transcript_27200/m.61714 type:complete len:201 (+) Transcript_27200:279-881(+)